MDKKSTGRNLSIFGGDGGSRPTLPLTAFRGSVVILSCGDWFVILNGLRCWLRLKTPFRQKKKDAQGVLFLLVEMAGVEPASEDQLPGLSTSVAGLLRFPQCSAERQALHLGSL